MFFLSGNKSRLSLLFIRAHVSGKETHTIIVYIFQLIATMDNDASLVFNNLISSVFIASLILFLLYRYYI